MNYSCLQTFVSILHRDARVFQRHIYNRFLDACIWTSIILYVSQYIFIKFGMKSDFGIITMVGNIAAWGMLEVGTNVSLLISDLVGLQSTSYYLTLPIPQNWIFIRIGLMDAYKSFITTLPMIPLGKLVLWPYVSLTDIVYGKFILIYLLAHLFFGFFGLFLSSITPDLSYITTIKLRIIFPLWFLGGYQFSWQTLYQTNKWLAYLNLANPVIYIMEGLKSTINISCQLIPFWICICMTVMFTLLFTILGIHFFKKRLDCL